MFDLRRRSLAWTVVVGTLFIVPSLLGQEAGEWNGLTIASEQRCAPYDRGDYRYPQTVEPQIVAGMGGRIYGPYTGSYFASTDDTQIEHIVALSEAHDSGACAWTRDRKAAFARDLDNLTLASPGTNASKGGRDAAEWLPSTNACWYAERVVAVKREYGLTVDRAEANTLQRQFDSCASTDMDVQAAPSTRRATPDPVRPTPTPTRRACCRICRTGKACGNSCISRSYTCRQPPGCACNGEEDGKIGVASCEAESIFEVPRTLTSWAVYVGSLTGRRVAL